MAKCKHSFNTIGTNEGVYVWWCNKCGCVEQGNKKPTLTPSEVSPLSLYERFMRWLG